MASSQANGRRGGQVNFSNFIQDLNVEVPSQNTSPVSEDWEKDLAMFTNTNFFEWEKASAGASADFALPEPETKPAVAAAVAPVAPAPATTTTTTPREPASATSAVGDFDFSLPGKSWVFQDFSMFVISCGIYGISAKLHRLPGASIHQHQSLHIVVLLPCLHITFPWFILLEYSYISSLRG